MKKILVLAIVFMCGSTTGMANENRISELEAQLNALASYVESQGQVKSDTYIGGYGEMHYRNLSNTNNTIDFHRFVLFLNHDFSDNIRFFSELEVEHAIAGAGQGGALELEQAFLQLEKGDGHIKVGMFLVPVGIINETHEPTTFYGVERNPIEKYIIPTTWREGGVMYAANHDNGASWDVAVHSGLKTTTSVRGGRQNVGNAVADSLAYTGRIKYTGISGLDVSLSLNQQQNMDQSGAGVGVGSLIEAHVIYAINGFKMTALKAHWRIENGQDTQGSVFEMSYRLNQKMGVFFRQNSWDDTGAGDKVQSDAGLNYWSHEDVVFKFDVQQQNTLAGYQNGFNLGMGYQF